MQGIWKTVKIFHANSQTRLGGAGFNQVITSSQQLKVQRTDKLIKTQNRERRAKTMESHTSSPKKQGINISLAQNIQQTSPQRIKVVSSNKYKKMHMLSNQSSKQYQLNPNEYSIPSTIRSKTNLKETPYRAKDYKQNPNLSIIPVDNINLSSAFANKEITRFKNETIVKESLNRSKQKIDVTISPRKMTSLRQTSCSSKLQETIQNSNTMRSAIDYLLNESRPQNRQKEKSVMRLSSSIYTKVKEQVFQVEQEQSSQTCSQQLNRQSSFLHGYIDQVTESIIVNKTTMEKEMRVNQSNKELHDRSSEEDIFKPSYSSVNQHEINSPSISFRKRNGQQAINLYDKKTILSRSIISHISSRQPVVYESLIIEHEISSRFVPLSRSIINMQQCRMLLARQKITGMIVTTKEVPVHCVNSVNDQIRIYHQIEQCSLEVEILQLYQLYIHRELYILIKQPFQLSLQQFIMMQAEDLGTKINLMLASIQNTLLKIVTALANKSIKLIRLITVQDIVYKLGVWKFHSPNMFAQSIYGLSVDQAIKSLRMLIKSTLGENQTNKH